MKNPIVRVDYQNANESTGWFNFNYVFHLTSKENSNKNLSLTMSSNNSKSPKEIGNVQTKQGGKKEGSEMFADDWPVSTAHEVRDTERLHREKTRTQSATSNKNSGPELFPEENPPSSTIPVYGSHKRMVLVTELKVKR